jgi:hypothetical protein
MKSSTSMFSWRCRPALSPAKRQMRGAIELSILFFPLPQQRVGACGADLMSPRRPAGSRDAVTHHSPFVLVILHQLKTPQSKLVPLFLRQEYRQCGNIILLPCCPWRFSHLGHAPRMQRALQSSLRFRRMYVTVARKETFRSRCRSIRQQFLPQWRRNWTGNELAKARPGGSICSHSFQNHVPANRICPPQQTAASSNTRSCTSENPRQTQEQHIAVPRLTAHWIHWAVHRCLCWAFQCSTKWVQAC